MRKIAVGIICITLLFLSMPGIASAKATPKKAFEGYYLNYLDKSVKLQETLQEALLTKTLKLSVDADLKDINIDLTDGTKLSNVSGNASFDFAFNLANMNGLCDFNAKLSNYDVKGLVFMSKDGIIVPRETIQSLATAGVDFSELGDLNKLPAYVVYSTSMSEGEWTAFNQAFTSGLSTQKEQTEQVESLMKEILEIIPDNCYYYSGSYAVLDLTKLSLTSEELLSNLKSHSESLTDKVMAISMSNPTVKDNPDFKESMAQARSQMITSINNLTIDDMAKFQEMVPFSLNKCQIFVSRNGTKSTIDITGNIDGNSIHLATQDNEKLQPDVITSDGNLDLSFQIPDLNLDLNMVGNSITYASKATGKLALSGKADGDQNSLSGKVDLNTDFDWSRVSAINIPVIDEQNSKRVEPKIAENNAIQVYMDGDPISFSDTPPQISNGRVMLTLQDAVATLDCNAHSEPPDTIIFSCEGKDDLIMHLDSTSYQIGDQIYSMDVAPYMASDQTYVPIRVIAEYYGLLVDWDEASRTVFIYQK